MNPRRYPRTLTEAFGPYCRGGPIHPMPAPITRRERVAGALLSVLIGVALGVALVVWFTGGR